MTELQVECYSGHRYAQEPRAFVWQGQRFEVEAVEARWRTPERPAFRVRAQSEKLFDLRYDEIEDRWSLVKVHGLLNPGEGS